MQNINSKFFYLKDSYCLRYNNNHRGYEKYNAKAERLILIDSVERITEFYKHAKVLNEDYKIEDGILSTFSLTFREDTKGEKKLYMDKASEDETVLEFLERIKMPNTNKKKRLEIASFNL